MCPCHPEDSQFTVVLLAAAGALLFIGVLRRFWPTMTTGLRLTIVTAGIVSLACVAFAVSRWSGHPGTSSPDSPLVSVTQGSDLDAEPGPEDHLRPPESPTGEGETAPPTRMMVYYFHRTIRCPACQTIEDVSREAIETGFVPEIRGGHLAWQAVNIEETAHEHFVQEFGLTEPSLVLVRMKEGHPADWYMLEGVWDHVEYPAALQDYVQMETQLFYYAEPASEP